MLSAVAVAAAGDGDVGSAPRRPVIPATLSVFAELPPHASDFAHCMIVDRDNRQPARYSQSRVPGIELIAGNRYRNYSSRL